jgi:hypothetical protein
MGQSEAAGQEIESNMKDNQQEEEYDDEWSFYSNDSFELVPHSE